MDYKKKYKEALEKARQLCAYPTTKPFISDLQDLFPELTESNDERIRKELIDAILGLWDNDALPMPLSVKRKDEWIAWLEKQSEKPINDTDGEIVEAVKNTSILDMVEQKPARSEENVKKPNGGIVMEDFNDGNGFYKANLAYLNEEQVKEIEELVKRWDCQPKENEDESIISDLLDYFEEDKCLKHEVVDIIEWLRTIKSQQKQRWSDNEKKMLCNLIVYLDNRKDLISEVKDTYVSWLKSLKNRVLPQPKQEWSEEDEVRLQACLDTLQAKSLMGKVDTVMTEWLKSLKDRVQPIHEYSDTEKQEMFIRSQRPHFWKPSDEQVKALKYVAYHLMPDSNYREEMFSLYEDLKKLK